eukprot:gnl/MRDRNA2_/MRDRNA2_85420_c0_seq1.p1 gnl/MRDRNA2_/MRDRNA2_85420_c0~~gnl/MRDRNA2_/MRDRNA2_85420_c0_seq1.p1  ORF type:complete len:400 (+),score=75.63 gnl/MRDRNA2_/MRDRNA2_85420_c0_seq1:51-1202(+)
MAVTFFEYPDPLVWWQVLLWYTAIAWGAFILGVFSIGGGAIFVPSLLLLPGMTPAVAIGTCYAGAVPMTWARASQLYRLGRLEIRGCLPLMGGAVVGALSAQAALKYIPSEVTFLVVAFLAIWAGQQMQRKIMKEWKMKKAQKKLAESAAKPATEQANAQPDKPVAESAVAEKKENTEEQGNRAVEEIQVESAIQAQEETPPGAKTADLDLEESTPKAPPQKVGRMTRLFVGQVGEFGRKNSVMSQFGLSHSGDGSNMQDKPVLMVVIGVVGSFLSSLSGTGGPLILFPLWLIIDPTVAMKDLVSYSVPFATTLVTFSLIGALLFGDVDIGLALGQALVSMTFILLGGRMQERMADSTLKLSIGIILLFIGLSVACRTIIQMI